MNSRKLVYEVLEGKETPRSVCGPLAVHFCARAAGINVRDYTLNAKKLAESIIRYYEQYKPDAVWVSADTWVTAEAMGAEVWFPGEDEPMGGSSEGMIQSLEDIEKIPAPDPSSQGRQPLMLEAVRRIKEAIGDEVFVVGCFDQSPFSLSCAMAGINNIMEKVVLAPEFVRAMLAKSTDYVIAYAEALADCGVDMLSTGDSPAVMLGPDYYEKFGLPAEQKVFQRLRETTDCKLSLHICGDATKVLPLMAKSGAHILELDSAVDIEKACELIPETIAIWGNLDPANLLFNGSPEQIKAAAVELLQKVRAAGRKRFVLSSGCTLAPATPPENVKALIEAVVPENI
jgi:MtaA/CmuA family methyltransferase